jgi:hypothetical protein
MNLNSFFWQMLSGFFRVTELEISRV